MILNERKHGEVHTTTPSSDLIAWLLRSFWLWKAKATYLNVPRYLQAQRYQE